MSQEPSASQPAEVPGEIVAARRAGISWVWFFPLLALAATGWLYWTNWKAQGPEITICFDAAPGVESGKTALIYRGVRAGTVSKVDLDHELGKVVVSVRLKAFASHLAREDTDFWIEQPVITLREIAGLESIIQGNSIHARTHHSGTKALAFQGLPEAPLTPLEAPDLVLRLRSQSIPFLGRGTPVFHRGVNVGWVRNKVFDAEGIPEIEVIISERFANKVKANSRFWVMPATAVSASPGSLRLDIPALQGLLDGSLAFDHFGPAGEEARSGADFDLSSDEFAARAEGPRLSIAFEDGTGLRAGETRVTCLGQPVGLVEQVTPNPASRRVEVVARLNATFAPRATADSVFTIVRPSLSSKGIQGLETLVTGPYIAFEPGPGQAPVTSFVGRELRQLDLQVADFVNDGIPIVLWSEALPQLQAGAPLYHHGMIAGRVIEQRIGERGRAELVAKVDGKFRDQLRVNTRFWRVPAAVVAVGPGVVGVEMQGLSALWQGGVAFDAFGAPGRPAADHPAYELYVSEHAAAAISEPIRITFADGAGLFAGKTELRYLGLPVGIVEQVRVLKGRVEATARFQPGYEFLRRSGSQFAIIGPEVNLQGVHGLDTLVGGVYIGCAPGTGTDYPASFNAVGSAVPALMNKTGLEIILESPATKIAAGAPVCYNDTVVGEVIAKKLSSDGKRIILTARIQDDYSNLVRSNSMFWQAPTVEAKVGFFKVRIDNPSLVAPAGRIGFLTPDTGGTPVKKRSSFVLLAEPPRALPAPPPRAVPAQPPQPKPKAQPGMKR